MSRSMLTAAALFLAMAGLGGCQVTDSLFGAADEPEPEPVEPVAEAEPAPLPPYQPPPYQPAPYQQPVYQQPPYQQPPYQQPPYQQPPYQQQVAGAPPYPPPGAAPPYQQPGLPPPPPAGYPSTTAGPIGDASMIARGEYLVTVSGCSDCHTDGALIGEPSANRYLAGTHVGINVDGLGVMYAPNLTPEPSTGLGNWAVHDIVRALRDGVRPDGSEIRPPMPIEQLSQLTVEDATAIAVYLKSIPPVYHLTNRNPVPKARVNYPYVDVVDVKMSD